MTKGERRSLPEGFPSGHGLGDQRGTSLITAPALNLNQPGPRGTVAIRWADKAEASWTDPIAATPRPHGGTAAAARARSVLTDHGGFAIHRWRRDAAVAGPQPRRRAHGCALRDGR
jgi:hypothetical protein